MKNYLDIEQEMDPIFLFKAAIRQCMRQTITKSSFSWLQNAIVKYLNRSGIDVQPSEELIKQEMVIWFIKALFLDNDLGKDTMQEYLAAIEEVIKEIQEEK